MKEKLTLNVLGKGEMMEKLTLMVIGRLINLRRVLRRDKRREIRVVKGLKE